MSLATFATSLFRRNKRLAKRKPVRSFRPRLESLEERWCPTKAYVWNPISGGNWDYQNAGHTQSNWTVNGATDGTFPSAATDTATIDGSLTTTICDLEQAAGDKTISGLTIQNPNANQVGLEIGIDRVLTVSSAALDDINGAGQQANIEFDTSTSKFVINGLTTNTFHAFNFSGANGTFKVTGGATIALTPIDNNCYSTATWDINSGTVNVQTDPAKTVYFTNGAYIWNESAGAFRYRGSANKDDVFDGATPFLNFGSIYSQDTDHGNVAYTFKNNMALEMKDSLAHMTIAKDTLGWMRNATWNTANHTNVTLSVYMHGTSGFVSGILLGGGTLWADYGYCQDSQEMDISSGLSGTLKVTQGVTRIYFEGGTIDVGVSSTSSRFYVVTNTSTAVLTLDGVTVKEQIGASGASGYIDMVTGQTKVTSNDTFVLTSTLTQPASGSWTMVQDSDGTAINIVSNPVITQPSGWNPLSLGNTPTSKLLAKV